MAKISYTNLKLKINDEVKTLDFNGSTIEIKQYLPIEEKFGIVSATLESSSEENYFNPIREDMLFHLNLVFMYTNINFTEKQKEDAGKLYNAIYSSGLLDKILELIPESEYEILYSYLNEQKENLLKYNSGIIGTINSLMTLMSQKADGITEILEKFDTSNFQEVINLAKNTGKK